MSLPNYLAKIKSAGMYRFTFDKSQVPPAAAETMRLVVGYSEKGPFNNPVYIDNRQDFLNIFGNINKRLERKGVFFHRMALQALQSGPILALNLKPFDDNGTAPGTCEEVGYISFDPCDKIQFLDTGSNDNDEVVRQIRVLDLFDRDRFWKIDPNQLPERIEKTIIGNEWGTGNKYINIAATDTIDSSCSIFIRKCAYETVKEYDVTISDWYKNIGEDVPDYLADTRICNSAEDTLWKYFAEIYVFRGGILGSPTILSDNSLGKYFTESANGQYGILNPDYTSPITGEKIDVLAALAANENSRFIGSYRGCLLPAFKDQYGADLSLDLIFNSDSETHKLVMKFDENLVDELFGDFEDPTDALTTIFHNKIAHWGYNTTTAAGDKPTPSVPQVPLYINGYTYGSVNRSSSADAIYKKSLDMLKTPGIFKALTNHVDSEYHYIVDTFATPVVSQSNTATESYSYIECGSKANLALVAKEKDNCLAILNAPSRADFHKINSFSIKNLEKGKYKDKFSLPSLDNGASHCAFYTPVVFADGMVRTTVPSAALVSNLFMEKWSSRQPYSIVAGPNYGVLSYPGLVGPDYNYSREDLDVYEPMGINTIIYVPRKGTYINSNQTAKQTPVSALSKVHVRELVTYLQNEIEAMLQGYQWELNTAALRSSIKASADAILDRIMNNGGVYAYLNVCDSTNNTADVIDNEMVILDTSIEPARGAGKMVQRLTIHKTGGISSAIN